MILQSLLTVVGAIMLVEGLILLTMKKESWQKLLAFFSQLSFGQVHFIGIVMSAAGLALILIAGWQ